MNPINVTAISELADHNIKKAAIAIGVFDGVHKGHVKLLEKLITMAKKHQATPVVMTFFPHPRTVLTPDNTPKLLVPQARKNELLFQQGIQAIITIPFTNEFSELNPKEFIHETLLNNKVEIKGICVGSNWRFGAKGSGSINDLKKFARKGHFDFESVNELIIDNTIVSSSEIRQAAAAGNLQKAELFLGRKFEINGSVIKGFNVASKQLDCATANLAIETGVLPPDGVYAARVCLPNNRYFPAAVNIGLSPTFAYENLHTSRFEVHIIGLNENLYNQHLRVEMLQYIREERTFPSKELLKEQIAKDLKIIKAACSSMQ